MDWWLNHRAGKRAVRIADRHYNRQRPGTPQFVPPGRCFVLITDNADALWVTSWPFAEFVHHAWPGAWINSLFRNESDRARLSSDLIRQAVAATRDYFGEPPSLGMLTFIDPRKVRRKRDLGRCYRKAGFVPARCPVHTEGKEPGCAACQSRTKAGLFALQMFPEAMPEPEPALGSQKALFA